MDQLSVEGATKYLVSLIFPVFPPFLNSSDGTASD